MTKCEMKALIFDIDGVITDGKKYTDGMSQEIKTITYKDLDAINEFKKEGILIGCVSGEDTAFSRKIAEGLSYYALGRKDKRKILQEFSNKYGIGQSNICYVGDGKYDIEALEYVGIAVCPYDAIDEVKKVVDIVLHKSGGQGCIAELYTIFHKLAEAKLELTVNSVDLLSRIKKSVNAHYKMMEQILDDKRLLDEISVVSQKIINLYQNNGQLFLCGNGGSAADAQHISAELVGKFYRERKAYSAEALSTNTSIITALANDYDYNMIFSRQIEAKGKAGDVLIGITTSGKSINVIQALKCAKRQKMLTILMSGQISQNLPILDYADHVIEIPSDDTPRIQEGHILVGHIICEIIELKLTGEN